MSDLRALAQADLDDDTDGHTAHVHALESALGLAHYSISDDRTSRAILAAIASAERRGRAEVFGQLLTEFKRESQSATDRARHSSDERKEGYAMAMQDTLRTIRSRAGMVGASAGDLSNWEALVTGAMNQPRENIFGTWDGKGEWCCRKHTPRPNFFTACDCGNKRCPHADDCAYLCTRSNEPGQIGVLAEPRDTLNGRAGSGSEVAADSEATKATETETP